MYLVKNGVLYNSINAVEVVDTPPGVKVIAKEAFWREQRVVKAIINEGVEEIEEFAFGGCYNLAEVHLPQSLKRIHRKAFQNCFAIRKVTGGSPNLVIEPGNDLLVDAMGRGGR